MNPPARPPTARLYYGWIVVAVTAAILLLAAGTRSAPGVFLLPMLYDTGLSRSSLSFAVSVGLVVFGLGSPLAGMLIDRHGPRRVTTAGLLLLAASLLLSAVSHSAFALTLTWGVLSGLGTGLVGSVLGAAVANRWFVRQRGLIVGLFGAATSAGQLMFIPALTAAAAHLGWRPTTVILGALAAALLLPTLLLLRNAPGDVGLAPDGDPALKAPPAPKPDPGVMARALRTPNFWLLAGTFFICGATSNGIIGTHFIAYAADCGIVAGTAAGFLALMGAFNFVGTLASGYLTDRYDPRKLLGAYYAFRGLSLLVLPLVGASGNAAGLVVFAVLFGLDYIATVPPTTAIVADTYGRANVGTVYGWVFCAHQFGAAGAAWLGGLTRDHLGSYGMAFVAAAALCLAGAALTRGMRRTPAPLPTL
ncbi:MFS transporter [Deinococcus maricopensis]|uniref:Major facilitator superfamily MFS_1 n=1 Tax=Deinococcus maricopensis (strain DSM 21211 / LMG 22137 / NRRL B-23946 / LB-34) TaxID=709986 RepID=E8U9V3_DEIML|nr:MFS transporter [Deinococcus maricopensis]ADV67842.1 major facilitator superfamily MFS_1 [Deinococcus maricopensis DSM 21211]